MPLPGPSAATIDLDSHPRATLSLFDDVEYCFELARAGVQSHRDKKQVQQRVGADEWLLFIGEDFDDLLSRTVQAGFRIRKEFAECSRNFRDIAVTRNAKKAACDSLFMQDLPQQRLTQVLRRLQLTSPHVCYPRQQSSIQQVSEAMQHVMDASIASPVPHNATSLMLSPTPSSTVAREVEVSQIATTLRMADKFLQLRAARSSPDDASHHATPHLLSHCALSPPPRRHHYDGEELPLDDYDVHPREHTRRIVYDTIYDASVEDQQRDTDLHQCDNRLDLAVGIAEMEEDPEAAKNDDTGLHLL
ncbi:hypothetical protein C8Q76DRAFT_800902 [Earliella scabrosa]|nr:hypothetical protein C8Q76DRAFT_800902 [Earliella scabrosa]